MNILVEYIHEEHGDPAWHDKRGRAQTYHKVVIDIPEPDGTDLEKPPNLEQYLQKWLDDNTCGACILDSFVEVPEGVSGCNLPMFLQEGGDIDYTEDIGDVSTGDNPELSSESKA